MWKGGRKAEEKKEFGRRSGQGTTLLSHVASQDESEGASPLDRGIPKLAHSFMRRAWTRPLQTHARASRSAGSASAVTILCSCPRCVSCRS